MGPLFASHLQLCTVYAMAMEEWTLHGAWTRGPLAQVCRGFYPSFFEADHSHLPMTMWGQTRVLLPPRQLPWGLREGWVQCDWCWAWCYFIYTRDEVPELCGRCLQLYRDGGEPPWWPNERQRWRLRVQRLFRRQLRHDPPIPV